MTPPPIPLLKAIGPMGQWIGGGVKKIVILCGPTAVGKSKVAMEIASKLNAEIISADSQQVWKEMDIGTAKPTLLERHQIPHHVLDVVFPNERFEVGEYLKLADAAIEEIIARGKVPLVVGGAGMYLRVLLYGLCEAPPHNPEVRQSLMEFAKQNGLNYLYQDLQKKDPTFAKKIHHNDKTRIIRALEVYAITEKPFSEFQSQHGFQKKRYHALQIGLNMERSLLHQRIENRVDWMIANGWAEEVRELLKFYPASSQGLQSIGYKQLVQHLQGVLTLQEATEEIKKKTRAFARRQLTWFRGDSNVEWMSAASEESMILQKILKFFDN